MLIVVLTVRATVHDNSDKRAATTRMQRQIGWKEWVKNKRKLHEHTNPPNSDEREVQKAHLRDESGFTAPRGEGD